MAHPASALSLREGGVEFDDALEIGKRFVQLGGPLVELCTPHQGPHVRGVEAERPVTVSDRVLTPLLTTDDDAHRSQ